MADLYFNDPPNNYVSFSYSVTKPKGGWRRKFDEDYQNKLKPIAETLTLLDGNAFTGSWQNYLQEADALYRNNGGDTGWASECSWIKRERIMQEDPVLTVLWNKLQMLIALKENENETI